MNIKNKTIFVSNIKNMIQVKNGYVNARELHGILDSKKEFSTWIKGKLKSAMLEEGADFIPTWEESTGGRKSTNYLLTIEAAEEIAVLQKTVMGKKLRKYLLGLQKQVQDQKLLTVEKSALAYKMIETFKFGQYQLEAEDLHKDRFRLTFTARENVHKAFSEHRNLILGINNEELKTGLIEAFNRGLIHKPQAKNIRGRIALIDRYKLIRDAVADYLISVGTNTRDALNFADTVKDIAQIAGVEIKIKDEDTLFDEKVNAKTPLQLEFNNVKLIK